MTLRLITDAGDNLETCFDKSQNIIELLGLNVEFNHNGVKCLITKKCEYSRFANAVSSSRKSSWEVYNDYVI